MTARGVAVGRAVLAALARPSVPANAVIPRWIDARPEVLTAGDPLVATPLQWRDLVEVGGPPVGTGLRRRGAQPAEVGGAGRPGDAERPRGAGSSAAAPWPAERRVTGPVTGPDLAVRHAPTLRPPGPPGGGDKSPGPRVAALAGPLDSWVPDLARPPRPDGVPPRPAGVPPPVPVRAPAIRPVTAFPVVERIAYLTHALLARSGVEHRSRPRPRQRAAESASVPSPALLAQSQPGGPRAGAGPVEPAVAAVLVEPAVAAVPTRPASRARPADPGMAGAPMTVGDGTADPALEPSAAAGWTRPARGLLDALASAPDRPGARQGDAATGSAGAERPAARTVLDAEAVAEAVAAVLADQARRHGVDLP